MPREGNAREKCSSVIPPGREEQADYSRKGKKGRECSQKEKEIEQEILMRLLPFLYFPPSCLPPPAQSLLTQRSHTGVYLPHQALAKRST